MAKPVMFDIYMTNGEIRTLEVERREITATLRELMTEGIRSIEGNKVIHYPPWKIDKVVRDM
jgi:hypothetical protein